MNLLLTVHSWLRWVVLAALAGAAVYGIVQALRRRPRRAGDHRPFALATVVLDVQVAVGILLWLGESAWASHGLFIAVIHPVAMLIALGVAHVATVRSRKAEVSRAHLIGGLGMLASLVIVVLAIPRWAWF